MYLKALEMQGFKSFPDKTVLNFDHGMTAVVGPNGSGKSNISDAVMWVLGEQSVKSLRSSKMEDVIFSGTEKRRAMGYAEVTLRLDNSDRGFSADSDEICVTRRYYRSGESEYKINGKTARLKDIHELFMDTGLGRDGYSMVGQGRIESIVSAKSADRREIFEEAAGISHYRYRRADALKRLDQAEENLVRLRDIAGELESRIGPLKKQSEKALEFLELSAKRKDLEIGLWLHTLDRSAEMIRRQSEKSDIAQNQYDAALAELDAIYDRSQQASEQSRNITIAIEKIQRNAAEKEQAARDTDAEAALICNRMEYNETVIARIGQDMQQENNTDQSLEEKIRTAVAYSGQLQEEIENQKKQLCAAEQAYTQLTAEENRLQGLLLDKGSAATALANELARHKIASTSAQSAVNEIRTRLETIEKEFAEKQADIEKYRAEEKNYADHVEKMKQEIADLDNSLNGYRMKTQLKEKKLSEHKKLAEESSAKLASLISRKHMLEETERNMDGYQGSVKAVIREAERGSLHGVRGPVSRLITVDAKYAVAVETALGAAVQNVVTETENDAKQAMYFLKNTNAGRATFLPMTAIKPRYLDENGLNACIGFIAVASDLVSCDNEYAGIAGNLLGRTVIAETLDDAVGIAKKFSHRFKIVTLDGQVINAGGSMTGGSGIRSSGFMSRSGEIEKLADAVEKARKQNDDLKREVQKLSAEAERAEAEQDGIRAEIFRLRENMVKEDGMMKIAASAADAAENAVKAFVAEKERADARLVSFGEDRSIFEGKIAELEHQTEKLSRETDALEQQRAELLERKELLTSEMTQINIAITECVTDLAAKTEVVKSLESRKSGHMEKIESLKAEQDALKKENETLSAQAAEKTAEAERIREEGKQQMLAIDAKVIEREQCEKDIADLRMFERKKSEEKENLAAELVRLEEKKTSLLKEREETEKKLFEEYNLTRREAQALGIEIESVTEASAKLADIKRKIKSLGNVNVGAVDEYKEVSERYAFLHEQLGDVESSKAELLKLINELTDKMSEQFRNRFEQIKERFSVVFAELFGGGRGELVLEDESDILECGIEIKAQPPGKNVKSISLLSGGEKGLCAIALLFAILKVNPAPFCIFDEVEAALDDVNVTRFAQYVRAMTGNTQFILITHRRGSMEEADVMYGVTMQEQGVSKLLELRTSEMAKQIGIE